MPFFFSKYRFYFIYFILLCNFTILYLFLYWIVLNWCFWTVVLEKTLESTLDCKEIKPINPKGNQPWIFIRRTDAEGKTPILWTTDGNSLLIGKEPAAGNDRRQEEKGTTEDEMVGSDQIRSVAQSCPTLCDPMNHSTPGLPVHHQLPEFTQTHVHWVGDTLVD